MEAWKIIHPPLLSLIGWFFFFIRIQKYLKFAPSGGCLSTAVYFMPLNQSCINQNICIGIEQPLCWLTWNAHMWVKWKVEPQGLICSCRLSFFPVWGWWMLILDWGHFFPVIKCLISNPWGWSLERLWPGDQRELPAPAGLWCAAGGWLWLERHQPGLLWSSVHAPARVGVQSWKLHLILGVWNVRGHNRNEMNGTHVIKCPR